MWRAFFVFASLMVLSCRTAASDFVVPEAWQGETQDSTITISYNDLDYVLDSAVLMSGPPSRKKSKASSSTVSTRLKNNTTR